MPPRDVAAALAQQAAELAASAGGQLHVALVGAEEAQREAAAHRQQAERFDAMPRVASTPTTAPDEAAAEVEVWARLLAARSDLPSPGADAWPKAAVAMAGAVVAERRQLKPASRRRLAQRILPYAQALIARRQQAPLVRRPDTSRVPRSRSRAARTRARSPGSSEPDEPEPPELGPPPSGLLSAPEARL